MFQKKIKTNMAHAYALSTQTLSFKALIGDVFAFFEFLKACKWILIWTPRTVWRRNNKIVIFHAGSEAFLNLLFFHRAGYFYFQKLKDECLSNLWQQKQCITSFLCTGKYMHGYKLCMLKYRHMQSKHFNSVFKTSSLHV